MEPSHRDVGRSAKQERLNAEQDSDQSGSGSSQESDATRLAEEMRKKARKRREQRRAKIKSNYMKSMAAIEETRKARLNEVSKRMINRWSIQLQRIQNLMEKRSTVEANILASSRRIEDSYILANHAFQYALERRVRDIGAVESGMFQRHMMEGEKLYGLKADLKSPAHDTGPRR